MPKSEEALEKIHQERLTLQKKISIACRDKCKEGEEFSYDFYEGKCLAYYNALSLVREIGEEGAGGERR